MRFNSMEETCCYKAGVVGSIPTAATTQARSSMAEYPAFNRRVVSSSLTGPTENCLNGNFKRLNGSGGLPN